MKTLLIYSGGLDSTTLLHYLLDRKDEVRCLSFDYDQKHKVELIYAKYWTDKFNVPHEIVSLAGIFAGSALTGDKPMPQGHYTDISMRQTVVPNRNMVMLAIAASKAIQSDCDAVAYAAHADDRGVYPDCRQEFVTAMDAVLGLCDWKKLSLITPFLGMTKKEVYKRALELGVRVDKTWSCYEGGETPCGRCGACSSRQEAIAS